MVYEANDDIVITVPEHLSKNYFQKVLQNGLKRQNQNEKNCKNNIKIINLKFSMGSSGGENYCSQIFRVLTEYSNCDNNENTEIKKNSLIVKYVNRHKEHSNMLEKMKFYDKEVLMLSEIMPNIERILNNNQMFAPKFMYATKEPSAQTIIMQDLNAIGYTVADRLGGLDEAHSKVLLWKLGQYHAATMVLAKTNPELMETFNRGMFQNANIESELFDAVFIKNLDHICGIISKWSNYETIIEKLQNIKKNFKNRVFESNPSKETDIRVLNHGDLWVNNFLFKYSSNNVPNDVVFVDLQICYYAGLGIDINYFLNTSVQIDILKSKRYELLRHYYKSLRETLEQLKYSPIPSWNDIKNEIRDKEFYGFIAFEAVLPLISMDREASRTNSLETIADEKTSKEKREIMFSSKRILETLKYSLDRFDELGVLD